MTLRVIVVGAGITGAAVAFRLARAGAHVTVIEAGGIAQAASGRSFGWINASFHHDANHYRLRLEGMAAWRRLAGAIGPTGVSWCGCLWWEEEGQGLARFAGDLAELGYPCRRIGASEFRALEPAIASPPPESLLLPAEGATDLATAADRLIAAAAGQGARILLGLPVTGFVAGNGGVAGVETLAGRYEADLTILATGTATGTLLASLGEDLPLLKRPGILLRTRPVLPVIRHVLAAPGQELRQTEAGHLLAPASPNHQADAAETLDEVPDLMAVRALARLSALLPQAKLEADRVILGMRPVPGDGLPAIGPAKSPGLYLAVMHSGATLGPLAGELVAAEVMSGSPPALLAPYRPARFA